MMSINALQSADSSYRPLTGSGTANSQRSSSTNNSAANGSAASAASTALQSTQVTLSASADLNFYNIPTSLGLSPTQQNNPWSVPAQQSGSAPPSGATLLGEFAENELASQLSSPSALAGATVTMNSFCSQSTSTAGIAQETSSGQTGQSSATAMEASNSITLQGSGDITLADGEVIPFTAELNTSVSVVQGSATQTSNSASNGISNDVSNAAASSSAATAPSNSAASPSASTSNLNAPVQLQNLPDSSGAQSASKKTGTGLASEWASMLQQYKDLLNLFDTVQAAVESSKASQVSAANASNNATSGSTQAVTAIGAGSSAANAAASTAAVA